MRQWELCFAEGDLEASGLASKGACSKQWEDEMFASRCQSFRSNLDGTIAAKRVGEHSAKITIVGCFPRALIKTHFDAAALESTCEGPLLLSSVLSGALWVAIHLAGSRQFC